MEDYYWWWNFALAALFGVFGYLVAVTVRHLTQRLSVRMQFRYANEDLVHKIQELVRAQNDVLLLELEVQDLVEKIQPDDRARWLVRVHQLAHTLPPMVLLQIERFGLTVPPPLAESPQRQLPQPSPEDDDDPGFAQVIHPPASSWTGRRG